MNREELEVFDGLMLSDGTLELKSAGKNASLKLGFKHKETIDKLRADLPSLHINEPWKRTQEDNRTQKTYISWAAWSPVSPLLTEQRSRWYPVATKIVPDDVVLTPNTIYWWYIGDGYLDKNDGTMRFFTNGFSEDEVKRLANLLRLIGLHPTVYNYEYSGPFIYLPWRDQERLFAYIGECRNPEYSYKWRGLLSDGIRSC